MATEPVKTLRGIWEMGLPSKRISPAQGWYSPVISLLTVDLPQPLAPTMAMRCPGRRLTPSVISRFA